MPTVSPEAQSLHQQSIVADLHVDPIIQHFLFGYDVPEKHDSTWLPQKRRWLYRFLLRQAEKKNLHSPFFNHVDVPRMLAGGYTLASFTAHFWPFQSERAWKGILKQLKYFQDMLSRDQRLLFADNPGSVREAHKAQKLAAFAGVEGAHCLGKGGPRTESLRLERLEKLARAYGVRILTLTHFSKNDAATPCMGPGSNEDEGLSRFGRALIERMNALHLIVDVAHVNNQGVLDACDTSHKPVVASHTGARGVHEHPRNLSDTALKAIADTGGVVGIIFATNFLSGSEANPTSEIILKHMDYIIDKIGEDHLAIGTDFDGWIPRIPQDLNDAADLPLLTQKMLDHGYAPQRIKKILGENFLRVWEDVLS